MSKGSKQLNFKGYKVPKEFTKPQRVAHALDWAATHYPHHYVSYNVLLQVIDESPRLPRIDNPEVEILRRRMHEVKRVLFEKYQRRLANMPGIGVRATVDSADVLKTVMVRDAIRVESVRKTAINTASLITLAEIPNTDENRPLKEWFGTRYRETLKLLSSPDWVKRALPPKPEGNDGGEA